MQIDIFEREDYKKICRKRAASAEFDKIFGGVEKILECIPILQYSYFVGTNTKVRRKHVLK